ncbi:MAG: hypothetical protein JEZ04_01230 [Spirochaetales bacterium]|nr:hypothetical protein [Spirochaetales bacterium]
MNIRKIAALIIIITGSIILLSCPGVVPSIIQGDLLAVDSEGHLIEDVTYNAGGTIYTYRADGTYLVQSLDSDGNVTGGSQGTYTWDQATLELVLSYEKYWTSVSRIWENYTDSKTETLLYYFSNQRLGYAYKLVENTENAYRWQSITVNENGNTVTWTISVTVTASSFSYNEVYTTDDNTGARTYGYEVQVEGTVDAFYPEGVKWEKGNTITVSLTQTSGQDRYWDYYTDAWESWSTLTSLVKELRTYAHMGNYVISLSGTDWIPLR